MRVNLLKLTASPGARLLGHMEAIKDAAFVNWFETEIYGGPIADDFLDRAASLNMRRD